MTQLEVKRETQREKWEAQSEMRNAGWNEKHSEMRNTGWYKNTGWNEKHRLKWELQSEMRSTEWNVRNTGWNVKQSEIKELSRVPAVLARGYWRAS